MILPGWTLFNIHRLKRNRTQYKGLLLFISVNVLFSQFPQWQFWPVATVILSPTWNSHFGSGSLHPMNAQLDRDLRSLKARSKTWALCRALRAIPKWYLWPGTPVLLRQNGSSHYKRGHVSEKTVIHPFCSEDVDFCGILQQMWPASLPSSVGLSTEFTKSDLNLTNRIADTVKLYCLTDHLYGYVRIRKWMLSASAEVLWARVWSHWETTDLSEEDCCVI